MQIDVLALILRQIAASFPETDYGRINSFALINGYNDLQKENFGASHRSGDISYYWGRRWDASGNNPDYICAEFNLLFITPFESITVGCKGDFYQEVQIGVVVPMECEGCDKLLKHESERRAARLLWYIIQELNNVRIVSNGVNEGTVIMDYKEQPLDCVDLAIECKQREIKLQEYGANNMTLASTIVTLNWCDNERASFDYSIDPNENVYPQIKCKTC
jgi:hypothetical protein